MDQVKGNSEIRGGGGVMGRGVVKKMDPSREKTEREESGGWIPWLGHSVSGAIGRVMEGGQGQQS